MKKLFYTILCLLTAAAAYAQNNNPLSYPYYISGTTAIDPNDGTVILSNISYKGFSCKEESVKYGVEKNEKAVFTFEEITTNPKISLFGKPLQYWRQDESGAWMTDAEGGNGIMNNSITKDITVILVLDCSSSLGDDFIKVKNGAIAFINKLKQASSDGHVKLGIVGFSSMNNTKVFGLEPLTTATYISATNFISSLTVSGTTALYFAADVALEMFNNVDASENFDGAYMLLFTDGIDTGSRFNELKLFKEADTYSYVKDRMANTKINGKPIESYVIGAKGDDLKTAEQISKFKSRLEGLVDARYSNRFTYLENMANLENTFSGIAEGLVQRWQTLYCNSAINHEGGVCWTYGELPAAPVYVPKPKPVYSYRNVLLGLNVGIGCGLADGFGAAVGGGVDYAHPVSDRFAIGVYGDVYGIIPDNAVGGSVGLMTAFGNFSKGDKTYIAGLGMSFDDYCNSMFDLRFGGLFRNGLYIMGQAAFGGGGETYYGSDGYYSYYEESFNPAFTLSIKIGFNFGKFIKVRKR